MKLYIVHVGFYDKEIGIYELHSNILVVAPDAKTAKQITKTKDTFINKKMHIDGIQEITNVDGYSICVSDNKEISQADLSLNYEQAKIL